MSALYASVLLSLLRPETVLMKIMFRNMQIHLMSRSCSDFAIHRAHTYGNLKKASTHYSSSWKMLSALSIWKMEKYLAQLRWNQIIAREQKPASVLVDGLSLYLHFAIATHQHSMTVRRFDTFLIFFRNQTYFNVQRSRTFRRSKLWCSFNGHSST